MKKFITLLLFVSSVCVYAQNDTIPVIEFSKFKLGWFNIMGFQGGSGSQTLNITFKNVSSKPMKYVLVKYWGVDPVGEIVTDNFNRKEFSVKCTGPFLPWKQYKQEVQIALFYAIKLIAYPYEVELTYMDGSEQEIKIEKNNISNIFVNIPYMEIGNIYEVK